MQVNAGALAQFKTNMTQRLNKRRQRGVTLVELAVAVAVMGLIMAGAMMGVPRLMASVKLTQEIKDWQMASISVQNAVASGRLLNTATQADVTAAGIVDSFNKPTATTILNRFGGVVTVVGIGTAPFPSSGVTVTSADYPTEQCKEFGSKLLNVFSTLSINGVEIKTRSTENATRINTACGSTGLGADGTGDTGVDSTKADMVFTIAG
ncbi:prepilin-type cleavage/methylation domain-containing protein [Pandoraea iniqua]|uniref:type II secretion system protein n=1 Tax=Pandoraea iniqua TaxID=2508288 RepID=UPI00125C0743|nr:type II secretion system protein [Pandoraea iniqua]VVD65030.1 prepilin-type cleavage/methylation domain-containing protein [Pandoraea iniqua]